MKFKIISLFIFSVGAFISPAIFAQTSLTTEYKAEIGISGGTSYYIGDANSVLFKNLQFSYGGFLRYIIDNRFAVRAEFNNTKIKGVYNGQPYGDINGPNDILTSFDVCGEFNFFDLEKNPNKQFSKIFSPFIFLGLGAMTDVYKGQSVPEISCPFGVGVKVKIAPRWNLNLQWSNKLLLPIIKTAGSKDNDIAIYHADALEDLPELNNPHGLNGSNIFNNDLLSTLTVGISFDFWEKQCNCLNSSLRK